jgi:hypothetical protein
MPMIDRPTAPEPLSPELVSRRKAWRADHPWLHQAVTEIGPGARGAVEGWRVRIEEELRTTLDFKVKPDGTAVMWCGMSSHVFPHYPTPRELFEGLGRVYRLERDRRSRSNQGKLSAGDPLAAPGRAKPQDLVRALPRAAKESFARALAAVALLRAEQLVLIFLGITGLTLVLAAVAVSVR